MNEYKLLLMHFISVYEDFNVSYLIMLFIMSLIVNIMFSILFYYRFEY